MIARIRVLGTAAAVAAVLAAGGLVAATATTASPAANPAGSTTARSTPAGPPPAGAAPTTAARGGAPSASPNHTEHAAPPIDPCVGLSAGYSAAVKAHADGAAAKAKTALDRARAGGCADTVTGKQSRTGADLTALARSLGVSAARVTAALQAVKQAGTTDPAVQATVFARALGVARAPAEAALQQLMAAAHPGPMARVLASRLGVAVDQAQWALQRVTELGDQPGGARVTDPSFVALAQELGVSPQRFWAALQAARHAVGTSVSAPSPAPEVPAPSTATAPGH